MKPLRPRYTRIQREVSELLSRVKIKHAPVPVEDIAQMLGAKIVLNDFNNEISGVLIRRGTNIVIGVAKEQAPTRQRFTIAHEIGHLLLHEGEEVHVDRDFRVNLRSPSSAEAVDVNEIEANAFAASLLMPEKMLQVDVKELAVDFEDATKIDALASRYKVSNQAMTFRLINLFGNYR